MTEEIFRRDAYAREADATVVAAGTDGIELGRTIFYPEGGGQPGDTGRLTTADGREVAIIDTRKDKDAGRHLHIPAEGAPMLQAGEQVHMTIDWERRHKLMRMHTTLHLICAVVDAEITGCQIGTEKSRIDLNTEGKPDKDEIQAALDRLVAADHPTGAKWITDAELVAQPDLVKTMSVQPPTGAGTVRLIEIEGIDLQPCGGTHVARTGEIGRLRVGKIENKGKHNRRVNVHLED
jgi:misacylated tRNA(Ala) deacylase